MDKKILRVFVRKTSLTPNGSLTHIGSPDLFTSKLEIDEIHISTVFTWDIPAAQRLQKMWQDAYPDKTVLIGGPAFGMDDKDACFNSGQYVKKGIVFTTRGCDCNCPWCLVPKLEGKFREIPAIADGHIIQDNNLLLSSESHFQRVCNMLKMQKRNVEFKGGLDVRFLKGHHIRRIEKLRIGEIWTAFDSWERESAFLNAAALFGKLLLTRDQLRCYVLLEYDKEETLESMYQRMRFVWKLGFMPFTQMYRSDTDKYAPERYSKEMRQLARIGARPLLTKIIMNRDYKTYKELQDGELGFKKGEKSKSGNLEFRFQKKRKEKYV